MTHKNSHSDSFRYTKKQMIGSGGTAVVYLATDHKTEADVAIKLISKQVSAEPKFQARFEREIEMLKTISHPNILPVLNHGKLKDQLYIVMPYISGGSVRDLLENGPIAWEQTLHLMEQVCPALDMMHEAGFIHRDIKPHNILVREDGSAIISDFGISRPIEATQDNSVTHTLDIVGTPEFIAPEQAADGELSAQTDIYQLGVTVFYMLTGQRLFSGSALQVIAKHIGEKPGSAGDIMEGLPRNIDAVLHMALAKNPINRFRTAGDFLSALQLLGDQNTVTFQHLPGFPLRGVAAVVPLVAAASSEPAVAVYEAVVPASGQNQVRSVITPSAAPVSAKAKAKSNKKRRPLVRYAIAGFSIAALVAGGFFFIPGAPGGGNSGGGNGGNGGGGRGNGGNGQGGALNDNVPTLVEAIEVEAIEAEAIEVEAIEVEAIEVEAIEVEAIEVEAIEDELVVFANADANIETDTTEAVVAPVLALDLINDADSNDTNIADTVQIASLAANDPAPADPAPAADEGNQDNNINAAPVNNPAPPAAPDNNNNDNNNGGNRGDGQGNRNDQDGDNRQGDGGNNNGGGRGNGGQNGGRGGGN
jgi:uncharacterized membrane protein YgcG